MGHHAPKSPSGFYKLLLCAGSWYAEKPLPNVSNPEAIRGTAAHTMLEIVLQGNAAVKNQQTLVVPSEESEGGIYELNIEDTSAVREALQYIENLPGGGEIRSELKVDPGVFLDRDDVYGTLDVVITINFLGDIEIEIIDYKHGVVVVEVPGNSQLVLYTLGLIAKEIEEHNAPMGGFNYKLTIVQPRAYHPEGTIRSVRYTYTELMEFAKQYKAAADAADDPNASRTPGVKQCRYCLARTTCAKLREYVISVSQGSYVALPDPGKLETALLRQPEALSVDELRVVLDNAPIIKAFLKAVDAYAQTAYLKGIRSFGHKLVAGRGTRSWVKDDKGIKAELLKLEKIGGEKIAETDITKPAALTTPKQTIDRLKTLVDKETLKEIKALIRQGHEKPKLVPETNAALALRLSVDDFFEVEPVLIEKEPWES